MNKISNSTARERDNFSNNPSRYESIHHGELIDDDFSIVECHEYGDSSLDIEQGDYRKNDRFSQFPNHGVYITPPKMVGINDREGLAGRALGQEAPITDDIISDLDSIGFYDTGNWEAKFNDSFNRGQDFMGFAPKDHLMNRLRTMSNNMRDR